jgi:hypothetical protein
VAIFGQGGDSDKMEKKRRKSILLKIREGYQICTLCGEPDCHMYGDHGICESCVKNAANEYVYEHSGLYDWRFATDEQLAEQEERQKANRQKQKKRIPAGLRTKVFERDGYKCLACGSQKDLRCDHVIPESNGGPMEANNMQTLCQSCNSKKGAKHIDYRGESSR